MKTWNSQNLNPQVFKRCLSFHAINVLVTKQSYNGSKMKVYLNGNFILKYDYFFQQLKRYKMICLFDFWTRNVRYTRYPERVLYFNPKRKS